MASRHRQVFCPFQDHLRVPFPALFDTSALLTVNDTKAGEDFDRTFRYIFTGAINDEDTIQGLLADHRLNGDEALKTYIREDGLLVCSRA